MSRILAPHKEQDGWVYVRERRSTMRSYRDARPGSRIISSRRVERAVENDDYEQCCQDELLVVTIGHIGSDADNRYCVFRADGLKGYGASLKEAYWRCVNGG